MYNSVKIVQNATTSPITMESRFFLIFILWIRLLIKGYLLDISLNLVCKRFKVCLWLVKCSLVSIAIDICSFTKWSELKIIHLLKNIIAKTSNELTYEYVDFPSDTYSDDCLYHQFWMNLMSPLIDLLFLFYFPSRN